MTDDLVSFHTELDDRAPCSETEFLIPFSGGKSIFPKDFGMREVHLSSGFLNEGSLFSTLSSAKGAARHEWFCEKEGAAR